MIPAWKVRRELARLSQQLRAIPEAVWEPFAQRRHDAQVAAGLPTFDGRRTLGQKVALLLLYQPGGLADSTMGTCAHLAENGYSVLVVSNAPLAEKDRKRLEPLVWRMVERPNFGYDFGGYRDGVLLLQRWGIRPARLVILNDSIWFPLWPGDETLSRLETLDCDIAGNVLRRTGETSFLESYLYSIRGNVIDTPAFAAFWTGLRLTSNKYKVIRRGERGFSLAMTAAGITLGALFRPGDVLAALRSDRRLLRDALRFAAHPDTRLERMVRGFADGDGEGWQGRALAAVDMLLAKAQVYSALPVAAVRIAGYPVLKKSGEPVSGRWRAAWLAAIDAGVLPAPDATVLAEVRRR